MEGAHIELPPRDIRIAGLNRNAVSMPAKPSSLRPRNIFQKLAHAWLRALLRSRAIAASACATADPHCRSAKRTHAFDECAHELSG